jgi:hypothetical protein
VEVPNVIIKKARHKHGCFLLCYDAKEIARQMTLIGVSCLFIVHFFVVVRNYSC